MPWPPNTIIDDRVKIESFIGAGGMGSVYKAIQLGMERVVAIKFLDIQCTQESEAYQRFQREAQLLSRFQDKNIVAFYGYGLWKGAPYMVLEYLEGTDLESALKNGPFPIAKVVDIAIQVCRALDYAHLHGALHRDIKPSNILLCPDNIVKVIDFGLAKDTSINAQRLTEPGFAVGSVLYMSPEQCLGQPSNCSPASDVYAVGCLMYHMISGAAPFDGDNAVTVLAKHVQEAPLLLLDQTPNGENVTVGLVKFVERCLEKDPALRYVSASDALADLLEINVALGDGTTAAYSFSGTSSDRKKLVAMPVATKRARPEKRMTNRVLSKGLFVLAAVCIGTLATLTYFNQGGQKGLEVSKLELAQAQLIELEQIPDAPRYSYYNAYLNLGKLQQAESKKLSAEHKENAALRHEQLANESLAKAREYSYGPTEVKNTCLVRLSLEKLPESLKAAARKEVCDIYFSDVEKQTKTGAVADAAENYLLLKNTAGRAQLDLLVRASTMMSGAFQNAKAPKEALQFFRDTSTQTAEMLPDSMQSYAADIGYADALMALGKSEQAYRIFDSVYDRCLSLHKGESNIPIANIYVRLAGIYLGNKVNTKALTSYGEAIRVGTLYWKGDDLRLLGAAYLGRGVVNLAGHHLQGAQTDLEKAYAIFVKNNNWDQAASASRWLAHTFDAEGKPAKCAEELQRAISIIERTKNPTAYAEATIGDMCYAAAATGRAGDWPKGLVIINHAEERLKKHHSPILKMQCYQVMAQAQYRCGNAESSLAAALKGLQAAKELPPDQRSDGWILGLAAQTTNDLGDKAKALEYLEQAKHCAQMSDKGFPAHVRKLEEMIRNPKGSTVQKI